jgi:monofunctional biosynthetic peptidoglycan transglycosylase
MRKIWIAALVGILLAGCATLPSGETIPGSQEEVEMKPSPGTEEPNSGEDSLSANTQPGQLLFDFQSGAPAWSSVDDSVMGGISQSASRVLDAGVLEFSGTMALENNGGFASVRSAANPIDLSAYDGILIRVLGDGQTYRLRIRPTGFNREISYNSLFETQAGEWITIYIPFETMIPTFRGFRVPTGQLDPAAISGFGFMLSDKQPGEFSLQVDWIRAVSEGEITSRFMPTVEV